MTSIFREVPSQFLYLVFSSDEEGESEESPEPPCKIIRYANEVHQPKLPPTFCSFLPSLLERTHCEYSIRCHSPKHSAETEDFCTNFIGDHLHVLLHMKSFVGAEKFIKDTLGQNITGLKNSKKVRNSYVKLFKISYPENCSKNEANWGGNRLFIHGGKLKSMLNANSTKDLGCTYDLVWELQRACYTEFDENEDCEKLSYICQKLAQLQKSNAVFKDCLIDFIDLLQRGFGTMNVSHHNNTLSVDLGFSNAQCQCYECSVDQDSGYENNANNVNFNSNLFSFIDENTQFV